MTSLNTVWRAKVSREQQRMAPGWVPEALHRFEAARLPAVSWKNGGGTTREVVTQPAGAAFDEFDWRVSIATIASEGPFSTFPGVDRTITLVAGEGMRLVGADLDQALDRVGVPFSFSGDVFLDSQLFAGEVTALNVMTRRDRCRAEVAVLDAADEIPLSDAGLVMSLQGAWRVKVDCDGQLQSVPDLAGSEGFWWVGPGAIRTVAPATDRDARPTGPLLASVQIFRV